MDLLTAPADLATWPELLCGEFEISPRVDERDVDIRDVHVVVVNTMINVGIDFIASVPVVG